MRRTITLLLLTALAVCSASAQWRLGVAGGVDWNWHFQDYGYASNSYYNSNKIGATAMLSTQYNFHKYIGVRADFGWAQRNHVVNRNFYDLNYRGDLCPGEYKYNQTRQYLMFPLTISFSYGNEIVKGYIDLGGYIGGWLSGTTEQISSFNGVKNLAECAKEDYEFDDRRDRRFDAGLVLRAGLLFNLPKNVYLNIETVDYMGLVNSHKTGTEYLKEKATDNTVTLQLGIGYVFNK